MCTSFIYLLYLYVCSVHMGALLCKNMERPKVDIRHLPQLFSTSFIDLGTLCWIQTLPVRIVQVSSSAFPWDTCLLVLHARITGRSPHSPVYMGSGHLSVLESSCFHSPWSSSGLFFLVFVVIVVICFEVESWYIAQDGLVLIFSSLKYEFGVQSVSQHAGVISTFFLYLWNPTFQILNV